MKRMMMTMLTVAVVAAVGLFTGCPGTPVLQVTPETLEFGADTDTLDIEIVNSGKGTLEWTIAFDVAWLSASAMEGEGDTTVTITVDRSAVLDEYVPPATEGEGEGEGETEEKADYDGTITVTNTADDTTVEIPVSVSTDDSEFLAQLQGTWVMDETTTYTEVTIDGSNAEFSVWLVGDPDDSLLARFSGTIEADATTITSNITQITDSEGATYTCEEYQQIDTEYECQTEVDYSVDGDELTYDGDVYTAVTE